jgi:hypothetical protein
MIWAESEFISSMIHPVMLLKAEIDDPVIGAKPIGTDDGIGADLAFNDGIKRFTEAVRHDLGIDAAIALVNAEDNLLPYAPRPRLPRTRFAPK